MKWSEALWHSIRLLFTFWPYIRRRIIKPWQCQWLDVRSRRCWWLGIHDKIVEGFFAESFWKNIVIGVAVSLTHHSVAAEFVILWWSWMATVLLFIWGSYSIILKLIVKFETLWQVSVMSTLLILLHFFTFLFLCTYDSTSSSNNSLVNTSQWPSICSSTSPPNRHSGF